MANNSLPQIPSASQKKLHQVHLQERGLICRMTVRCLAYFQTPRSTNIRKQRHSQHADCEIHTEKTFRSSRLASSRVRTPWCRDAWTRVNRWHLLLGDQLAKASNWGPVSNIGPSVVQHSCYIAYLIMDPFATDPSAHQLIPSSRIPLSLNFSIVHDIASSSCYWANSVFGLPYSVLDLVLLLTLHFQLSLIYDWDCDSQCLANFWWP